MRDSSSTKDFSTLLNQSSNRKMGITPEYSKENRDKLWDSPQNKAAYKDKVFGKKQTYDDPISGKTLHKSQKAAQNKYHMKNSIGENVSSKWAEYTAETDHINALKDVHDKAKHNPFLNDNDFKEIMNSEENYRIISKSDNASKGDKNDWKIIADKSGVVSTESKARMAKQKIKADVALNGKFAARTAQNVGKEFAVGAADALIDSAIPLMSQAVKKLVDVAQGRESLEQAAKDMGKITVETAVVGGTNKLLIDAVSAQLMNGKNAAIQSIKSNGVAQIISVAAIVQESAMRYINGEIDGKEFVEEVGEKGAVMFAGMVGGQIGIELGSLIGGALGTMVLPGVGTVAGLAAGRVVGEVLGTIITTIACGTIISAYKVCKRLDDYKITEKRVKRLEAEALREMENQRELLKSIVEREYGRWDEEIRAGFDMIASSAYERTYNSTGVTDGLDRILAVFGEKVAFHSTDEYMAQLDEPLKLKF